MASAPVISGLQKGATAEFREAGAPLTSTFFIALGAPRERCHLWILQSYSVSPLLHAYLPEY